MTNERIERTFAINRKYLIFLVIAEMELCHYRLHSASRSWPVRLPSLWQPAVTCQTAVTLQTGAVTCQAVILQAGSDLSDCGHSASRPWPVRLSSVCKPAVTLQAGCDLSGCRHSASLPSLCMPAEACQIRQSEGRGCLAGGQNHVNWRGEFCGFW